MMLPKFSINQMDLNGPTYISLLSPLFSLYADMAKSAMGSTSTEGEAALVAKKATGATMLSPDSGDLHLHCSLSNTQSTYSEIGVLL